MCAKRRSRSPRFDTSPWTAVTLLPISFTAAANSGLRRPMMKTYAPSCTNCFAVARPMPLLPPVMRALFPSSFPMYVSLGDFLKRISLFTMQQLVGSEYPTWVSQDGAPSGSQLPASLSCPVLCLFDILYGSTPPPDGCSSRSYFWPIPASSPHRPTSSHSSAPPRCPSNAQSDYICCGRAGNTVTEWASQCGPQTAPCDAETAYAHHYFQAHCPV